MPAIDNCLMLFTDDVSSVPLPQHFTFPFYYQPHPLAELAANELQSRLLADTHINSLLGIDPKSSNIGKMFGVLVVSNTHNQIGFLAAYSGQLEQDLANITFVPAVSDMQLRDEHYQQQSDIINAINAQVNNLENAPDFVSLKVTLARSQKDYQAQLVIHQSRIVDSRKSRKLQRRSAKLQLSSTEYAALEKQLAGESIQEKKQLQALKRQWQTTIDGLMFDIQKIEEQIHALKKQRKARSKTLQKKLFAQYQFLNANGDVSDLNEIFAALPEHTPPAGAGDCAAPKMLQYAYRHQLTPIAMAEFWWGGAPKSAIRQHKNYYPSCYSKCQPILGHMLKGLSVAPNPLLTNPAVGKELNIVFEDDDVLVINKPAEFLSVPGKHIEDSVYTRVKTQFSHASGPLIVHRLDMSTSGLLVIALNKRAHKSLQKQFIERQVKKRYVALVDGIITEQSGEISLPLRLDLDDKPRQLVCEQFGKPALTHWRVIKRTEHQTLLHLFPYTGRTHQLRVHCAHRLGLNTPIVGDDHYGNKAQRLHLHAEYLSFQHPVNKAMLEFQVDAEFA